MINAEDARCRLGVHWKFGTSETVSHFVKNFKVAFNTSQSYTEVAVACPTGSAWDRLKGVCIVSVVKDGATKTKGVSVLGFILVAVGILIVVAGVIIIAALMIHGKKDKKKKLKLNTTTQFNHPYDTCKYH